MRSITIICILLLCLLPIKSATKRALLVGISNYPSESMWSPIHGTNDVQLIEQTLNTQGFKVLTLKDSNATASKIRKSLARLQAEVTSGDIIYLHFSCHGQPIEDIDGDEDDGWDEALIPFDAKKKYQKGTYTGENHITDDELNSYLKTIRKSVGPKGFVYVVIDACHAGSSYRGDEDEDSVVIRGTDKGFSKSNKQYAPRIDKRGKIKVEKSANMANICILEACRSYQVNSEIRADGKYYGSLSYYVNKTLKSIKLDKSISWTEKVAALMNQDIRLVRQNPVVETSL